MTMSLSRKATIIGLSMAGVSARHVCDLDVNGASLRYRNPRGRTFFRATVAGSDVVIVSGHVQIPQSSESLVALYSATTADLSSAVTACGAPIIADYRAS